MKGRLILIPSFLAEANDQDFVANEIKSVVKNTRFFAVENLRTARRFISALKLDIDISKLHFEQLDKQFDPANCADLFHPVMQGHDLGLLSEAGLPGIADPGQVAIAFAHRQGVPVIPLPGASSIVLGLISSGFNGQQFTFHGYLPIKSEERLKAIRKMEKLAANGYTQVFMETPYRNRKLFEQLLKELQSGTELYIGMDITGSRQLCRTQSVGAWRKKAPAEMKVPAIFAIGKSIP